MRLFDRSHALVLLSRCSVSAAPSISLQVSADGLLQQSILFQLSSRGPNIRNYYPSEYRITLPGTSSIRRGRPYSSRSRLCGLDETSEARNANAWRRGSQSSGHPTARGTVATPARTTVLKRCPARSCTEPESHRRPPGHHLPTHTTCSRLRFTPSTPMNPAPTQLSHMPKTVSTSRRPRTPGPRPRIGPDTLRFLTLSTPVRYTWDGFHLRE